MYAGRIVESATTDRLFENPQHPYTQALLASVPDVDAGNERISAISGYPPSIYELPVGCAFAERCRFALPTYGDLPPPFVEVEPGHHVRCWRHA
jgi:oligopeptide transport system ATP-binding protein